ncbi:hypothetical protein BGZ60DRAFT_405169 [Tricladium varicosporioides]|nr:hypothetical protein BGZ60DRAFT_405169 [Hymenoscyphus varicosporioides]
MQSLSHTCNATQIRLPLSFADSSASNSYTTRMAKVTVLGLGRQDVEEEAPILSNQPRPPPAGSFLHSGKTLCSLALSLLTAHYLLPLASYLLPSLSCKDSFHFVLLFPLRSSSSLAPNQGTEQIHNSKHGWFEKRYLDRRSNTLTDAPGIPHSSRAI